MLTTWLDFQMLDKNLCTPSMSNLKCKPWFAKKGNYLHDNWFCNVNIALRLDWPILFTHPPKGGKLMTTSLSHLKVQKITSKTLMQTKADDQNWYQKTWSRNNLVVPSPIIVLVHEMKWTIFVKWSTTTKMESQKLKGGRFVMKSIEIENHKDVGINNGWKKLWRQWQGFFARGQTSQDLTNSFTYFQNCRHQ